MILGNGVISKIGNSTDIANFNDVILNASGCPHPSLANKKNIDRELKHIKKICKENSKSWIIHCSTPAVLGNGNSFNENDEYRENVTQYGMLKRKSEMMLLNSVKNLTILRIFSLTSTIQRKQIIWDAFNKISSNELVFKISKEQERNFVHEKDFVKYLDFIVKNNIKGFINITNTKSTNLQSMVRKFASIMGKEISFEDNKETSNYSKLSSNNSTLFSHNITPEFEGDKAPLDIFNKLNNG